MLLAIKFVASNLVFVRRFARPLSFQVLLCDQCSAEYHTYCLDPPLARIPDGDWLCHSCRELGPIPLASPTAGRPGRKKGSGRNRVDGRRVKVRSGGIPRRRSPDDGGGPKKRGRPLSAKGAERRAAEERTAERKATARFARETAAGAAFRMERFSGVLALEAPESPAIREARLAEEARAEAEALGEVGGAPEAKPSAKTLALEGAKPSEDIKPIVKPLAISTAPESAGGTSAGGMESAQATAPFEGTKPSGDGEVVKPMGAGSTADAVPGGEARALRSQGVVTPEKKLEKKRKGQNQWTKRKELAELAAKLAAEGKPVPPQPPRKHQNQYTKRKELALAAAKEGEKSPLKVTSSPERKSKPGVSVASRLKIARVVTSAARERGSPGGKGVKVLPRVKGGGKSPIGDKSPKTKRDAQEPKKGPQNQHTKRKEGAEPGGEVKRKGENQYTKAKRLAEEAQKEKEREKRKGENQYTKAKRLAEEAEAKKGTEAAEPKRKGENQYTKAKRLAEEAARAKEERRAAKERRRAEKEKRLAELEKDGKKRGENQYTKAKKLAEGGAKKPGPKKLAEGGSKKLVTAGGEVKRRGENQYTKAKRLAEEAAKEARREKRREKRKGENQYTKAKKLALLASEGAQSDAPKTEEPAGTGAEPPVGEKGLVAKAEVAEVGAVAPTVEAAKPPGLEAGLEAKPEKPPRKRENQYTKRKRLAEQGIEAKPVKAEPRSGLRSKDPETPTLRSGATPKQEKGPNGEPVVYTRRKSARGEAKAEKEGGEKEGEQSLQMVKAEPVDVESVLLSGEARGEPSKAGTDRVGGEVAGVSFLDAQAQTGTEPLAAKQSVEGGTSEAVGKPPGGEGNGAPRLAEVGASTAEIVEAADVTAAPLGTPADVTAGAPDTVLTRARSEPGPADVSRGVPLLEGRPAKRQRLAAAAGSNQPGGPILRQSLGGERRERRPLQSRGLTVRVIEPPKKKERTPEQQLADRMGECAYWDLTLSEVSYTSGHWH